MAETVEALVEVATICVLFTLTQLPNFRVFSQSWFEISPSLKPGWRNSPIGL